jgi:predicted SAM-dependent methyltransferase
MNGLDFTHTRLSLHRDVWSYEKVQRFVTLLIRNRHSQLRSFRNIDYLNVGSGPSLLPGFCNLDYIWRTGILCWDVTTGIPFRDSTATGIFSEHCLEHISQNQCLFVLKEIRRILRPNGIARIVVPDGELYCRLYIQAAEGQSVTWPYPSPRKNAMEQVNQIMREHGHQFIYDYETLRSAMLEAGFRDVYRTSFRQGHDEKLLVDHEHRAAESLYLEGVA